MLLQLSPNSIDDVYKLSMADFSQWRVDRGGLRLGPAAVSRVTSTQFLILAASTMDIASA